MALPSKLNAKVLRVSGMLIGLGIVFLSSGCGEAGEWETDGEEEAWRSERVTATAYNSLPEQTHPEHPEITAWGYDLVPGMQVLAVSPDLVEIGLDRGTEVHIQGLEGTWVVLDRMPSRWSRRIDLYMGEDVEAAREWGRQRVEIRWREDP